METNWPKAEERLRSILDTFDAVRGWVPDNPIERMNELHGARAFVDSIGERPDLLREAMTDMHDHQLLIASPRSCISWCRSKLLRSEDRQLEKMQRSDFFT